jgi:branched-subunit amino acid transport protein
MSGTTLWLVIGAIGLLTYGIRLSFILTAGRAEIPDGVRRALRFVPVAVLPAIVVPELVAPSGVLLPSLANPRLIAGALAVVVAWRTRNALITIVVGMVALWLLQAVMR